jgi:predicted RecB family endonuclease
MENRMKLADANNLDRKSGEAEGSAVRPYVATNLRGYKPFVIPTAAEGSAVRLSR